MTRRRLKEEFGMSNKQATEFKRIHGYAGRPMPGVTLSPDFVRRWKSSVANTRQVKAVPNA